MEIETYESCNLSMSKFHFSLYQVSHRNLQSTVLLVHHYAVSEKIDET